MIKKVLLICVAVFWILIGFGLWSLSPLDKDTPTKLVLDVGPGQSFYQLAKVLEQKELIRSAKTFKVLIWLWGRPHLKQGEYELSSAYGLWKMFVILKSGQGREFKVSFPEGFNHYEMAELLKSHGYFYYDSFLQKVWDKALIKKLLKADLPSLEGYLFPDTYSLNKYLPPEELIENLLDNFIKNYKEFLSQKPPIPLSRHEILTLASLIEKETGKAEERSLIASVFFNRLNKKMKLQTDPTILYSLYLDRGFNIKKNIRKKDILRKSDYNTYVVWGLPPGPIANPGKESLRAVFSPKNSDYLYFVSRNDGSHKFSKSYKEHKKAVYKYQIQAFQK